MSDSSFTWRGVEMRKTSGSTWHGEIHTDAGLLRFGVQEFVLDEYVASASGIRAGSGATFACGSGPQSSPSAALDAAAANLEELVRGMPRDPATDPRRRCLEHGGIGFESDCRICRPAAGAAKE